MVQNQIQHGGRRHIEFTSCLDFRHILRLRRLDHVG